MSEDALRLYDELGARPVINALARLFAGIHGDAFG